MEETRTLVDVGNGVKITMPCDKLMSAMAQMIWNNLVFIIVLSLLVYQFPMF
jgi:hypothetical protein